MCIGYKQDFFGASTTASRLNLFVSSSFILSSQCDCFSPDHIDIQLTHICKATKISFCQKRSSAFEVLTNVSPLSCHRPQSGAQP